MRERAPQKGRKGITIKTEGFNLTISPAHQPQGLRRVGKDPKEIVEKEQVKSLRMVPRDYAVLRVLLFDIFSNETHGVGDSEYENSFEVRVAGDLQKGGRITKDDYYDVVQGIIGRSKKIEAQDIARAVLLNDKRFRVINENDSVFSNALGALTENIQGFWEKKEQQNKRHLAGARVRTKKK